MLMAGLKDEAFPLAKKHSEMDKYAEALGESGTQEDYVAIGQYFEERGDYLKAGHYASLCSQYPKALKLFLQAGEPALDKAIEVVGKARSDPLTHQLINYLNGTTDGIPKDPNYIFRLYMALESYEQAAHIAVIIASQEQELGNYKVAHGILFDTYKDLEAQKIKIPTELKRNLMLLHSYILAKVFPFFLCLFTSLFTFRFS
jgi:WD repeat-containing protein 19